MGGSHIAIPTVLKIGKGALDNLGEYIRAGGMEKAVIYFGNGLVEMFGIRVMESLKASGVEVLQRLPDRRRQADFRACPHGLRHRG